MTTAELNALIGTELVVRDQRTGVSYRLTVGDVKLSYGRVRVRAEGSLVQFEPTQAELDNS